MSQHLHFIILVFSSHHSLSQPLWPLLTSHYSHIHINYFNFPTNLFSDLKKKSEFMFCANTEITSHSAYTDFSFDTFQVSEMWLSWRMSSFRLWTRGAQFFTSSSESSSSSVWMRWTVDTRSDYHGNKSTLVISSTALYWDQLRSQIGGLQPKSPSP